MPQKPYEDGRWCKERRGRVEGLGGEGKPPWKLQVSVKSKAEEESEGKRYGGESE